MPSKEGWNKITRRGGRTHERKNSIFSGIFWYFRGFLVVRHLSRGISGRPCVFPFSGYFFPGDFFPLDEIRSRSNSREFSPLDTLPPLIQQHMGLAQSHALYIVPHSLDIRGPRSETLGCAFGYIGPPVFHKIPLSCPAILLEPSTEFPSFSSPSPR